MRRIFVDTEWTAVPWSSAADLLWIGLADETGRSWCGLCTEARVEAAHQGYVSDLLQLITPDVPRLPRAELAAAVVAFCGGPVDEFWAWIPTPQRFAEWSGLGDAANAVYATCRDIDLQMLQGLVVPWPEAWPCRLHDLNAAAAAAGVPLPPRAVNHLHPRVHAAWNHRLFASLRATGRPHEA